MNLDLVIWKPDFYVKTIFFQILQSYLYNPSLNMEYRVLKAYSSIFYNIKQSIISTLYYSKLSNIFEWDSAGNVQSYFYFCTQQLVLVVFMAPYRMSGIESRLVPCKLSALPTVLSLSSLSKLSDFCVQFINSINLSL